MPSAALGAWQANPIPTRLIEKNVCDMAQRLLLSMRHIRVERTEE